MKSRWSRGLTLLVPGMLAAAACDRPQYTYADDVPISNTGAASSFGGTVTAGTSSTGGSSIAVDPCAFDRAANGMPLFSGQAVSNQLVARPEVYAELTDSEVAALKMGGSLIPKPVPAAPTPALTSLLQSLLVSANSQSRPLIQQLFNRFKATRTTWPNAWALRMIDHPGSEHMNPVRIQLKKDAWIARIIDGSPTVVDVDNNAVPIESAIANPARMAAIYYIIDDRVLGFSSTQCETGKRELALGNEAMVESFSIGTSEILDRLNADITTLKGLFTIARQCSTFDKGPGTFHAYTVCQTWHFFDTSTEYGAYQWALSNPVEAYKPTLQNLGILLQSLDDDRFEPDPFVGVPPPVVPEGGAGGEGGASGAGGDAGFPQGGI